MVNDEEIKSDDSNERKYNLMKISYSATDNGSACLEITNYSELVDFEERASAIQVLMLKREIGEHDASYYNNIKMPRLSESYALKQSKICDLITRRNQFLLFEGLSKFASSLGLKRIYRSSLVNMKREIVSKHVNELFKNKKTIIEDQYPTYHIISMIVRIYLAMTVSTDYESQLKELSESKNASEALITSLEEKGLYEINWSIIKSFFSRNCRKFERELEEYRGR